MSFTPARPFRTFQNKAWVSSNCVQCPAAPRKPRSSLHLCQRHPLPATTDSCNSTWTWNLVWRSFWVFWHKVRSSPVLESQQVGKQFFWSGLLRWCWWCVQHSLSCVRGHGGVHISLQELNWLEKNPKFIMLYDVAYLLSSANCLNSVFVKQKTVKTNNKLKCGTTLNPI